GSAGIGVSYLYLQRAAGKILPQGKRRPSSLDCCRAGLCWRRAAGKIAPPFAFAAKTTASTLSQINLAQDISCHLELLLQGSRFAPRLPWLPAIRWQSSHQPGRYEATLVGIRDAIGRAREEQSRWHELL